MPLPRTSLTPVTTRLVADAQAVWINSDIFSEEEALAHAVSVPPPDAPGHGLHGADIIGHADRYGGAGLGHSGGSGRCAILNGVQIKGVGRTPLATSKIDPFHSNGMLGFEEAMREAIWSEVAQVALPYGSVRTLAVIDTASTYEVAAADGTRQVLRRFLLLRQFALRPAHYTRNVHFPTPIDEATGLREDAVRTALAVQSLSEVFKGMFPDCAATEDTAKTLNIGLREIATRFAFQNATAMVKRIYHGGLSPSNIAMDGRYIDFGTITPVSAFRRRAIRPLETDAGNEYTLLLNTLLELRFFIVKYVRLPADSRLITQEELVAGFGAVYKRAQQIEFLKLTGVCESTVINFPLEKAERFRQCVIAITRHRNEPFVTWAGSWGTNAECTGQGRFDVGYLLMTLGLTQEVTGMQARIAQEIGELSVAGQFAGLYAELRALYLAQTPATEAPRHRMLHLAINALRRNADLDFLNDHPLSIAIAAFDQTPCDIEASLSTIVEHAAEILNDKYDTAGLLRRCLATDAEQAGAIVLGRVLPRTEKTLSSEILAQWEVLWNTAH